MGTLIRTEGKQVLAVEQYLTLGDGVGRVTHNDIAEGALSAPFWPIKACTSPSRTVRLMPFNISLPLMLACKSMISNISLCYIN